jgi:hypothetical protein
MKLVAPDFDRRIDLPGAGPCPRPVDIDCAKTGFDTLVSLRVYSFAKGAAIDGEAEGDEVFIVLMRGQADLAVESQGERVGPFALRGTGARALYLPPDAAYHLTAAADCDIAYARSKPDASQPRAVRDFTAADERLDVAGYASGMDLTLAKLMIGDTEPLIASDGRSPERFVHVGSDSTGVAAIGDATLANWDSAVIDDGEHATLTVRGGAVDVLVITASTHRSEHRD